MGGSTANASGMADYIGSVGNLGASTMANIGTYAHPERYGFDYNKLNDLMNTQAKLAYFQNKTAEQATNPTLAAARDSTQKNMVDRYNAIMSGNLPSSVQNALTKAGLASALHAGTVPMGDGSVGTSTAGQVFGQDLYNLQNQEQAKMNQYMMMNPEIQASLSPQSVAQGVQSTDNANVAQWNNWLNQMTNVALGNAANLGNAMGSASEAAMNAQTANAQGNNSLFGSMLGAGAGLAGSGLQAATMLGAFGPLIGMCWVAEELYGKDSEKTHRIRAFCTKHSVDYGFLGDFCRLYAKEGERWASDIKTNEDLRRTAFIVWGALDELAKEDR